MDFCKLGLNVIENEGQAIFNLARSLDHNFQLTCEIMLKATGRIVVTGMGKSGHIGKKIASTLASTGTPAFFMHPAEASHGDLGMLTSSDVILALSNSGNTQELILLLPLIKRLKVPFILLCGKKESILAKNADVVIDLSIDSEACPLGLAPTTSTTVALVMGDAIAVSLLSARGFSAEDFARSHPAGSLGRRLLLTVDDICHKNDALPTVNLNSTVKEALLEVTSKKLGITCIIDEQNNLQGVYTDGDIRRTLTKENDIHTTLIKNVMTKNCHTISKNTLAVEALNIMEKHTITSLVIVENNRPYGVIHLHDLLRAGVY